jgi:competence protein ComEC
MKSKRIIALTLVLTLALALATSLFGCLAPKTEHPVVENPHAQKPSVTDPPDPEPSDSDSSYEVLVHVLDVGEGLSVLIDNGDVEVLIDGGYMRYGADVSEYIGQYVDGDIEYVIATHSDSDHVGGLIQVYADYQVNCTIYGNESNVGNYPKFREAATNEPDSTYRNDANETLELSEGVTLRTIDVIDDDSASNNNSVISLLDVDGLKLLITGDAEAKAERLLHGLIGRVDVYVVGHHGSETSSSQGLLDEIRPKYGVISTAGPSHGDENPDGEVMMRLEASGTRLFATYRSGNINVIFDGGTIRLSPPADEQITLQNYKNAA